MTMMIMMGREKILTIAGGGDMGTIMMMSLIMGDRDTRRTMTERMKEREVDMKVHEEPLVRIIFLSSIILSNGCTCTTI